MYPFLLSERHCVPGTTVHRRVGHCRLVSVVLYLSSARIMGKAYPFEMKQREGGEGGIGEKIEICGAKRRVESQHTNK